MQKWLELQFFFLVKVKKLKKGENFRRNFLQFVELKARGLCHRP